MEKITKVCDICGQVIGHEKNGNMLTKTNVVVRHFTYTYETIDDVQVETRHRTSQAYKEHICTACSVAINNVIESLKPNE